MSGKPAKHVAIQFERIGRLLHTEAHAQGLLPVQWETLRYLNKANRFSRSAAALTAYLGLTKGTVSQSLNVLESLGLVKRQVDQKDRRRKRLSLTRRGKKLLLQDPLDETVVAVDQLASTSQVFLVKALDSILSSRLAAQDRQPFGQCRDCRYFAQQHPEGSPHYCQLLREKLVETDSLAICFEQVPKSLDTA